MTPYLPSPHNLAGAAGLLAALAVFLALGALAGPRRAPPEVALVAGWGLVCCVLTVWGVVTPVALRIPLAGLVMAGLACPLVPAWRRRIGALGGAGRVLLLSLPIWLVLLPARPSQVDTWLNLLPNAGYLFTYDMLPTAARPPSYSFLPVAPYNTQFAAYITSELSGGFADSAMALFSLALQCAAAVLLARVVAGRREPLPWWACATGLALAVPLNPGFVPRVFLASYGEAPLAVTALFGVWLAVDLIKVLAAGAAGLPTAAALGLVLAALVNIKQSGIGLMAPIGAMLLLLVWLHPLIPRARGLRAVLVALGPGIALYLIWRVFAIRSFVAGELEPLPFSAWNFPLLPQILLSMLWAMVQKATFFLCLFAVVGGGVWAWWRARTTRAGLLLVMIAGVTLLFNAFLVFTYIAHFPTVMAAQAHSYFRYASQLSLLVMLGLVLMLRPLAEAWLLARADRARRIGRVMVALIVLLPFALVKPLRFDLDTPQPVLWRLGHAVAEQVPDGEHLAVIVPHDPDDAVGSLLRGVLLFTPPARPHLDLRTEPNADPRTLADLAAAGYRLALLTCVAEGPPGLPPHAAALLRYQDNAWTPVWVWPYPADLARRHFTALLPPPALCAGR